MNELLEALGTRINSAGLATPDIDLFYDHLPGTPLNAVAVLLTGGPFVAHRPTRALTFQVVVRNEVAEEARTLANSIFALFDSVPCDRSTCALPGYEGWFYPQHEPGPHDFDENNHAYYTLNFRLEKL